MNQLIEAKYFCLSPRCEGQLSLTVVMTLLTQPRPQHIRIWREVNQFTLVLQDEKMSRNWRFYSHHEDYEENYTSVDFWLGAWPLIASGINTELEDTNECIELETEPLILPEWVHFEHNQLALPDNFFDFPLANHLTFR